MRATAILRSTVLRTLIIVLAALTLLNALMPAPAHANDSDQQIKTVRVGWLINNEGFQDGTPGERLSGWGYDYLQTLSYYTPGWRYEYVSGTFTELMDMLEKGEIDLLPNISYSAERAQKLLYSSNPEGTERYYIYAKPDRDDLSKGDPQALQGLTIGYNPGVMQTAVGRQWLSNEGITCTYKEFAGGGDLFDALANDEVDAIIMNDTISSPNASPMFYVGSSDYYFAVPKSRPDLMDDINSAMAAINRINPRYNDEVKSNYSAQNSGSASLTSSERSWLKAKKSTLTLGKALAANAAKTAFLTRMSHDIRTPLNGILGLIEIEELHEGDIHAARENRAKARIAANHLLSLINDILEMGRIENGKLTLEHVSFNLEKLCDDAIVLCKLRASEHNITMRDQSAHLVCNPQVIGSPTHVRQIIINLLDNSIKYNKDGGTVTFTSQIKPLDDNRVLFCFNVSDTGIGMSPEFLKHIYEPFAQEGNDARSKFHGTGMGMPIVKSLVDLMGGTIEVTSELGTGSTFYVQIPLAIDKCPKIQTQTSARALTVSLAGMSVLLAEDNQLSAEIAQTLLETEGIVVTHVENGSDAVDLYLSRPAGSFDAILMDIMMPGMDGYEAARTIRLSGKVDAADIPIIALTANAFAEDAQAARDAGMNAHLPKPLDFNKLKDMLACIKKNGTISL